MNQISGREIGRKIGTALGLSASDLADVISITLTANADAPADLTIRFRVTADDEASIEAVCEGLRAYRLIPRDPDSSDNTYPKAENIEKGR